MQNNISPTDCVFFVDDTLTIVTGTVVQVIASQAIIKRSDGQLFTGDVKLVFPLPKPHTASIQSAQAASEATCDT